MTPEQQRMDLERIIMGCAVECMEGHTKEWGRCALGPEWVTAPLTVDVETGEVT